MRESRLGWLLFLLWVTGTLVACSVDDAPASDGDTDDADSESTLPFEEYVWLNAAPDAFAHRLCEGSEEPESLADKVNIRCKTEGETFTASAPAAKEALVVVAYNIERGYQAERQTALFAAHEYAPAPDVLLLGEVDRGCSRTGGRHIAREYAQALGMNYVFAVEFVELPRAGSAASVIERACEHGNAILSRYPIGNLRVVRHREQRNWYDTDQPRLGGRIVILADLKIGERLQKVAVVHFESHSGEALRATQAEETAALGLDQDRGIVIGGDMNATYYGVDVTLGTHSDKTLKAFFDSGYADAHAALDWEARATNHGAVIDYIVGRAEEFSEPGVGSEAVWGELSDHLPLWVTVKADAAAHEPRRPRQ